MLLQLIYISLVSNKHVPALRFQSMSPGSVHWCGFHTARAEGEWCILLSYLAAQTVAARHVTDLWSPNRRPQSCRLCNMDSHSEMHLSETARDVKRRR